MSGLVKAKKYDWKDSNMALFGSDTDKQVKKESAMTEPAWEGAGQEEGLQIWRIVKFEVEHWPKEDYGKFYNGDSYIILNTYKEDPDSEDLSYDVHFWIGKHSTQDEYGTAAYKTVELDTFLDDKAVQHREVQGHESSTFRSYFKTLTIMKGGADSGFRHVEPESYTPRLMKVQRQETRSIVVSEVACARSNLNSGDVFVYDGGMVVYQWNGAESSHDERYRGAQVVAQLKNERNVVDAITLNESDISDEHGFYELLTSEADDDDEDDVDGGDGKELLKISDADGSIGIEPVKSGDISMDDLTSDDVFVVKADRHCFVYVGQNASITEKRNGMSYAHKYLMDTDFPWLPVTIVSEGRKNAAFEAAMAA